MTRQTTNSDDAPGAIAGDEPPTERQPDANGARTTTDEPSAGVGSARSVDVDGLTLRYGDGTVAVDDLSLSVPRGEFFGFLGPNGAGKTTVIKVLATLLDPTEGEVSVEGHSVTADRAAVRQSIGYMAQETSVDPELTARENLAFACEAHGVPGSERAGRIEELLELVALADVADTPAERFSGGMQKRLDAATALVDDPDLVFLDEPTTGLDPKARDRLWAYFERINDAGTTVFLTTQYLAEADRLCDRLGVIRDGSLVARGSPTELKRRVGGDVLVVDVDGGSAAAERAATVVRERVSLGDDATVEATADGVRVAAAAVGQRGPDVLVALRDADVPVAGFGIEEATLDDVFLAVADGEVTSA